MITAVRFLTRSSIPVLLALCAMLAVMVSCGPKVVAPQPNYAGLKGAAQERLKSAYTDAEQYPGDTSSQGRIAMLLHSHHQIPAALFYYYRARRLDPENFAWAYLRGCALASAGRHQEAAGELRIAVNLRQDYLPAQIRLAETLAAAGSDDLARQAFDLFLRQNPGSARGHRGAADLYQKLGVTAQAAEHYRLFQENKDADPPMADPIHDTMVELNAGPEPYLERARDLEASGKLAGAVEALEKAAELEPRLAETAAFHHRLLGLYGRLGIWENAERHFQAALRLDPVSVETHVRYAEILRRRNMIRESEILYRKALKLDSRHVEANTQLAILLVERGQGEGAIPLLRAALGSQPAHREANFQLGRLLVYRNKAQEGIALLKKSLIPEDSSSPGYLYALGLAYQRAGDVPNAVKYLTEAREKALTFGQEQLKDAITADLAPLSGAPGAATPGVAASGSSKPAGSSAKLPKPPQVAPAPDRRR